MAGVRQPAFLHQPGNSGSQSLRLQVECVQRLFAGEVGVTVDKSVIDKLFKGNSSQFIRKTRHKTKIFAYDLGIPMKGVESTLVLPFRLSGTSSRMSQ